ncbi:hypothetical protein K490DRAFT_66889 [Saccharata proteae CBS 121410]|uniref:Uncharacterized protein n=1 Tax=Saccharata proteae CBS 121410 TaxID=1314787 RepID=A0A9P4HTP2_9PEZI|nr:hypothetical protein K490DRAFT_66889 [Saccharata proteae CBS 121410]
MAAGQETEFSDLKQMLNKLCLEGGQEFERSESRPVTDFPDIVDSPKWDNEITMLPIYLEDSNSNPGPVKLVFMEHSGIDRTLLDKQHEDPRLDITDKIRQSLDLNGEDRDSWIKSELSPMLAGVASGIGLPGAAAEGSRLRYQQLVTDVVRYNSIGAASKETRPVEQLPEIEDKQVRLKLMANWEQRGQTATGQELLKWERLVAALEQVEPGKFPERDLAEDIRQCEKNIRRLNQQLWTQCSDKTLKETKAEMREQEEKPFQELIQLQALYETDLAILSSWSDSNGHLLQNAIHNQETVAITAEHQMTDLMAEIEVLDSHIEASTNSMRKVQTRARRLAARDVCDPEERKEEVKRRLEHPEALDFMLRSSNDVDFTRVISGFLVQHATAVASGLEDISGAAKHAYFSTRRALVDIGLRSGAEGIETEKQEDKVPSGHDGGS